MLNARDALLIQVSVLYYEKGLTQSEIAKRIHVSRPTVSNLLAEAREKNIVRISIQHPEMDTVQLQENIKDRYHLETVMIAHSVDNQQSKRLVGQLAAKFIERHIAKIHSLGIGWGTTLYEYVKAANFNYFPHLTIIPLIGGAGVNNIHYHSNHLAFLLYEKYQCHVSYFYAPAFAETIELKRMFERSDLFKQHLEKIKQVDFAICGVGNPAENTPFTYMGYINRQDEQEFKEMGVVGDILATFFDAQGRPIQTHFSDRLLGLSLSELKKIQNVLVLATGKEKTQGVKTLIELGYVNHIIIDNQIAEGLMRMKQN